MKWPAPVLAVLATLQAALPLLVVASLAGYTWWLVQSAPGQPRNARREPPPSLPDYVLQDAQVERFDASGRRVSVLQGQTMSHFLQGDRLDVHQPNLTSQDAQGQHLHARAALGRYMGDAGGASTVDLLGGAKVTATPASTNKAKNEAGATVFQGEALTIDVNARVLSANRPVILTQRDGILRGSSLRHDAKTGISVLGGRVTGSFTSKMGSKP